MVQVKTSIGRDFQDVMLGRLAASGYPATIYMLRRLMYAWTMRIDGGPAVRLRVVR